MATPPGNVGTTEPSTPTPSKQLTARRELTTSPEEEVGQAVPMTPPVEQGRLPTSSSSIASSWQPIESPVSDSPTPAASTPAADERNDWYSRWNPSNTQSSATTSPPQQATPTQQSGGSASSDSVSGQQTRPEVAPTPTESPTVAEPTIRDVLKQALMRRLTGRGGRGRSGKRST